MFSIVAVQIYIPTNNKRGFHFLHTFSSIYYLWSFWWWSFWSVWNDCSFDLHFSNVVISNVEHLFMSFFDHLCVFFEEMSIQAFGPCILIGWFGFFWCWVVWAICMFGNLSLVSHIICKHFLPVSRLSFCFVMIPFTVQKIIKFD